MLNSDKKRRKAMKKNFFFLHLESEVGRAISNNNNIQISGLKPFPKLDSKLINLSFSGGITLIFKIQICQQP